MKSVSLPLEVYQNLICVWGIYEKEIERFHSPGRRHPHNPSAVSLRFGEGGPKDRHHDIRADTQDSRAAFTAKVYATQTIAELLSLVNSSPRKGDRKVHISNSASLVSPTLDVSFGELGFTMAWNRLSVWCTFVCFMIRFADLLARKSISFSVHGQIDIADLLELVGLPTPYQTAILSFIREGENRDEQWVPPTNRKSSQGGPRDRPPEVWIREELEKFKALGVQSLTSDPERFPQNGQHIKVPDLQGELHPIFGLNSWTITSSPQAWDRLQPSLVLASRLLDIAAPWFASFVPRTNYDSSNKATQSAANVHVPMHENVTSQQLGEVRAGLRVMAKQVTWVEGPTLISSQSVWAQCHRGKHALPSGQPGTRSVNEHAKLDQLERRNSRKAGRDVAIAVDSGLVRLVVRAAKPGTENHLFAVFWLAVVVVSALAQAVWLNNFDHPPNAEVRVGNDVYPGLKNSLLGWLFGGWFPEVNVLGYDDEFEALKDGFHWSKLYQRPMQRPTYATAYSMPVEYIQRLLSQRQWGRVDRAVRYEEVARNFLKPRTPFQQRHTARMTTRLARVSGADWGEGMGEANYYEDLDWEVTPPPTWDFEELRAAGAVSCSVSAPSLTGNIHPIFAYKNWRKGSGQHSDLKVLGPPSLTKADYDKLIPALRLATLLIKVGTPWFVSFLPQIKWYREPSEGVAGVISAGPAPSSGDMTAATTALEAMAGHIHFDHNSSLLLDDKRVSLTSRGNRKDQPDETGNYGYLMEPSDDYLTMDEHEKANNLPYRRLQISLSTQVIQAILNSATDSELYLQATHALATRLTYELGNAALYGNFAWANRSADPFVQGEAQPGPGHSLIAWLHGGWMLYPSLTVDRNTGGATFFYGSAWRKWYRTLKPTEYVPRYWTFYSIPVHFIQRLFVQAEWDKFSLDDHPDEAADALLRPIPPFRKGEHARRAQQTQYEFWSTRGAGEMWYADGNGPDEDDDRVDPYYEDPDWEENPRVR